MLSQYRTSVGLSEGDPLGGEDPYSASKGAAEMWRIHVVFIS